MKRAEILTAAKRCVCGDREQDYGTPENNFGVIANLWTAYLGYPIAPQDVAVMMALVKIGRIANGRFKADSYVDACGYLACGGEIESEVKDEGAVV